MTGHPAVHVSIGRGATTFAFSANGLVHVGRVGSTYRIGAWLRTDTPGVTVCLRIEEVSKRDPLTPVRTTESCLSPTTKWEHFRIVRKTIARGDRLHFSIYSYGVTKGDTFEIDGFTVMRKTLRGWKRVDAAFVKRADAS